MLVRHGRVEFLGREKITRHASLPRAPKLDKHGSPQQRRLWVPTGATPGARDPVMSTTRGFPADFSCDFAILSGSSHRPIASDYNEGMPDGIRAYLMLVGAVLMFVVIFLAQDASLASLMPPGEGNYATLEFVIATVLLALATFAIVLAFLPSFFQWHSVKGLLFSVTTSVVLTAIIIWAYRSLDTPLF
jgi:hypothetical protein